MIRYKFDIPQRPDMYPMNLAFFFVGDEFYGRVALSRPFAREAPTFPFAIQLDCDINDEVKMYIDGQCLIGTATSDFFELEPENLNPVELSQDLRACGYDAEKFPALGRYL